MTEGAALRGAVLAALDRALATGAMSEPMPQGIGFAVSGGSDSMALLHLMAAPLRDRGVTLAVATVDHGLRVEARAEAEFVAKAAAGLGLSHDRLDWQPGGRGNLAARARAGRYGLLAGWAQARGFGAVLLGHTEDDQAETLFMRLARGSGPDGLSAMAPLRRDRGILWARPLLDQSRQGLRDWLRGQGVAWVDDPSNDNPASERVRLRQAIAALGLDRGALAQAARRQGQARRVLDRVMFEAAEALVTEQAGSLHLPLGPYLALEDEIRLRLIGRALRWIATSPWPPAYEALERADAGLAQGRGTSLHGALITVQGPRILITRELRAIGPAVASDALWDGRWRAHGPHGPGMTLRHLGTDGLAQFGGRGVRADLPHLARVASPAIWQGDRLIAAPFAGFSAGWRLGIVNSFHDSLKAD